MEATMRKAILVGAVAGALGLGLVATSATAAPVGGVALEKEAATMAEKVHGRYRYYYGYYPRRYYGYYGYYPRRYYGYYGYYPRRYYGYHRW
jgi:hypothetical protein